MPRRIAASECPRYEEFLPDAGLASFVSCLWAFSIPGQAQGFEHPIIPDGTVSLTFVRKRQWPGGYLQVVGPRADALWVVIQPGDLYWGVRLLPGAVEPLFGIQAGVVRNQIQPLANFLPELAQGILEKLSGVEAERAAFDVLEGELLELAAGAPRIDPVVREASAELLRTDGNAKIAGIASRVGMSERQFRRRFCAAVGLTPKQFSRALRVRSACIRLALAGSAHQLAAIAQEVGYADQAHLSRDFAAIFGSSAGDLAVLIRSFEHGPLRAQGVSDLFKRSAGIGDIQLV